MSIRPGHARRKIKPPVGLRIPEAHRQLFSFPAALFLLVLMLRLFAIP